MKGTPGAVSAAAPLFPCTVVFAQFTSYPDQPIRMVVACIVGQKLTESWGRQVIIDNHLGAGGNIEAAYVATAAPDINDSREWRKS